MKIYVTDASKIQLSQDIISSLPESRQRKIRRLKMECDKKLSAGAGLLIKRFISDEEYTLLPSGKPYFRDNCFFNISHSGDYAAVGISDCEIGLDIERIRPGYSTALENRVLHEKEREILNKYSVPSEHTAMFFAMWTKKEAFLKNTGAGLRRNPEEIDLSENLYNEDGTDYFFKTYDIKNYKLSVCSLRDSFPDNIAFVEF